MEIQRPKRSADQIALLPPFGSAERDTWVHGNGASFEPETLVYLLRESIQQADTALFNYFGRLLVGELDGQGCTGGHCEPIIMSVAVNLGLHRDADRLREFRAMVHSSMWTAIHAGSSTKHFWEERFGHALKDKCVEIGRRLSSRHRLASAREIDVDDEVVKSNLTDQAQGARYTIGTIDEATLLGRIQMLPERQRCAAFLYWVEGRQITGTSQDTVIAIMGISATAVHALLGKATAKLAASNVVRELRNES